MEKSQEQDSDFSIDILEQIGLKDSFPTNYIGETSRQLKNLGSHSQSVDQVWSSLKTTVKSVSESISDTVNMEPPESISERIAKQKKKRRRRKRMKQPKESTGSTGSATSEKAKIEYTVRDRDTLTSIAARFNSTPSELCLLNRRSNRIVFPGMRLIVPDPDAPAPASPTATAAANADAIGGGSSVSKSQSESSNFSSTSTNGEDDAISPLPGAEQRQQQQPPPNPEDPHERKFIKAKVRLMTHSDGVVSGTLLVTPNTILFDPNVSDPLVIERGPDMYSVAHPLGHVMSLNAYISPELMALRREEREAAAAAGAGNEYALTGDEAAAASASVTPASLGSASSFSQLPQQLMVDLSCGLFSTQRHDLRQVTDLSQPPAQLAAERLHPHTCTQFEDRPLYLCVSLKPRAVGVARCGSRRGKRAVGSSASRQDELWFSVARRDADMLYVFLRRCGAAAAGGTCVSSGGDQSQPMPSLVSSRADDYYFVEGGSICAGAGPGAVAMAGSWQLVCADQSSLILPSREDLPLPRLVDGRSRLLSRRRLRHLVKALPPRAEGHNLRLLYSAGRHGFSLKSAYRACAEAAAPDAFCLLLVLDTDGHLFGAFLSGVMRQSEHHYGTGETFVFRWERLVQPVRSETSGGNCQFTVDGSGEVDCEVDAGGVANSNNENNEVIADGDDDNEDEDDDEDDEDCDFYQYSWTGENTFFLRGATDAFTVGSCRGRCAIWLDSGLFRGRSQRCDTFNNPVLCGAKEDFLVRDIELWEFADPTRDY